MALKLGAGHTSLIHGNPRSAQEEPPTSTPDGASTGTTIVVTDAHEEYPWIRENCPGWEIRPQSCTDISGRSYDFHTLRHAQDSRERTIYFDITSFTIPTEPAAATADPTT